MNPVEALREYLLGEQISVTGWYTDYEPVDDDELAELIAFCRGLSDPETESRFQHIDDEPKPGEIAFFEDSSKEKPE